MNWKILTVASALAIIPLSTYAAEFKQEVNPIQESSNMRNIAQRFKHGKWGRGQKMDKLLQQIDLTPEQSQQISTIRQESKTNAEDLHQQMKTQHQEIKSLMTSNVDAETIRAEFQATQSIHQQLGNNRFETMLQIREILTAEQRAKIAELMEQHRERKFGM